MNQENIEEIEAWAMIIADAYADYRLSKSLSYPEADTEQEALNVKRAQSKLNKYLVDLMERSS